MAATLQIKPHGVVSTLATAVPKLRVGRENAGFGARTFTTGSVTTSYVDIYKFTEGTGTHADTYVKMSNNVNVQTYQQGQSVILDGNSFPTQDLADAGAAREAATGIGIYGTDLLYRSLSFKPATGSQYGAHIYQYYNDIDAKWVTVLGEVYVKPQNKPAAVTADNIALSQFMFYSTAVRRRQYSNGPYGTYYTGPRWVYTDSPYTFWAGRSPSLSYDATALYTRFSTGVTAYSGSSGADGVSPTTGGIYDFGTDFIMRSSETMLYDVWDVGDDGVSYKLARPLTLRHRARPIGVTPADFAIGPVLDAGVELTVSAGEVYTSLGGSLFLRTT
jgi:hypothetical protein